MNRQFKIECGRCGATKTESVTKQEAQGITDRLGPVYRPCQQCEKITGWILAKDQSGKPDFATGMSP